MKKIQNHIILFDGVCNLCNGTVQYVIKNDHKNLFSFASLQSDFAKDLLAQHQLDNTILDSIILVENGAVYQKSSAVLRILKQLGGINKFAVVFQVFPKGIRDFFYNIVAKNRYKWFGKQDSCMIPTKELKAKFLD